MKRDEALTIEWEDGSTSIYKIDFLRKMSPSAEEKKLREEMRQGLIRLPVLSNTIETSDWYPG